MLDRSQFDELIRNDAEPAVSIYLPTHAAGREVRQDPIQLKNLVAEAGRKLAAGHWGGHAVDILEPARRLVADADFWRHQQAGLAVFLAPGFERVHRLPRAVPQQVVVGLHFHIKPLLPLLEDARRYWLLTVSAARTRLYRGAGDELREASEYELPQGLASLRQETEYEEQHYAAPTGRHGGLAKAQVFGDAPDELKKTLLIELLRRVAAAVERPLRQHPAPLILAAMPEIQGQFRRLAHWPELVQAGIAENPDALAAPELARRAGAVLERQAEAQRTAELDRLNGALGDGGRATTQPEAIVTAARWGRVERLFLAGDDHLWGGFEGEGERIHVHGSPVDGDLDLLDYAALMTLRQGGGVTLVDRAQLPRQAVAAALLRY